MRNKIIAIIVSLGIIVGIFIIFKIYIDQKSETIQSVPFENPTSTRQQERIAIPKDTCTKEPCKG